jgi:hypothetical protein
MTEMSEVAMRATMAMADVAAMIAKDPISSVLNGYGTEVKMTATSTPTLNMRNVAAVIAQDPRENLAGGDVISVGPLCGELAPGGRDTACLSSFPSATARIIRPAISCST